MKPYREVDARWEPLGRTPLKALRIPMANLRLRIEKEGFAPLEVESDFSGGMRFRTFTLDEEGKAKAGMVRVPGGIQEYPGVPSVELGDFWLDRYEVTNRQYKEFVDRGGYRSAALWREPFVKGSRILAWEEAMALFRDSTGRPGPATWEAGTYPDGQAESSGGRRELVRGRRLRSLRRKGAAHRPSLDEGRGGELLRRHPAPQQLRRQLRPGGQPPGLSPFGAYDLAGNVKEWCWNPVGEKRYILGGGWNEPSYVFGDPDAKPPWDRAPSHGFRCAKYAARPRRSSWLRSTW